MKTLAKKYPAVAAVVAIAAISLLIVIVTHLILGDRNVNYVSRFEDSYHVTFVSSNAGITTVKNGKGEPMICSTPAFVGDPLHCSAPGSTIHGTK